MYLECSLNGNELHSHTYYDNTHLFKNFIANFIADSPQTESKRKDDFKVLNDMLDLQANNINLFNTQTGYIITNGSDAETIESIAKGSQDLQILIQDILSELQPSVDTEKENIKGEEKKEKIKNEKTISIRTTSFMIN